MQKHPLYLLLNIRTEGLACQLELRSNDDWRQSPNATWHGKNELLVRINSTIIEIGCGTKAEMMTLAHALFGTPLDLVNATRYEYVADKWTYLGDYAYAYRLQKGDDEEA